MSIPIPESDQHGWPFAEGPGQVVSEDNWRTMASTWQTSGVVGYAEDATVPSSGNRGLYATRVNNTRIQVQPGVATIDGYFYELKIATAIDIDITGTDGFDENGVRHDLLTLRLDRENSGFRFVQLKAAVDPVNGIFALELPGDEIPLVQLEITQDVGLEVAPIDRRWFIGRHVRSIRGTDAYADPPPVDGELGVDVANNVLVVGKHGQWVPASQVFNNDNNNGGAIAELEDRVTAVEGDVASLQGAVSDLQGDVSGLEQAVQDIQDQIGDGGDGGAGQWTSVTYGSGITSVSGQQVQVRKQGAIVHIRGAIRPSSGDFLGMLDGQTTLLTVPVEFRPSRSTYAVASSRASSFTGVPIIAIEITSGGALRAFADEYTEEDVSEIELGFSWMVG